MRPSCLVAPGLALLLSSAPSQACMNEVYARTPGMIQQLTRAEALMEAGQLKTAAHVAQLAFKGQDLPYGDAPEDLAERANLIVALALLRYDGDPSVWVTLPGDSYIYFFPGSSRPTREEGITWATRKLQQRTKSNGADVAAQAWYAEALAHDPSRRAEALSVLSGLEASDLIPDAWGFATLGALRSLEGDTEGAARATQGCLQRAPDAAWCSTYLRPPGS